MSAQIPSIPWPDHRPEQQTAVLIVGPTAVGKTRAAIHIAQQLDTAVLSADSRQCYKEMTIGTAVPSQEELRTVPHYFIQSHSIENTMNAGKYEQWALAKAAAHFQNQTLLVVCGGTGLYLKALTEGMDTIPAAAEAVKAEIMLTYRKEGLAWLQQQVQHEDPEGYKRLEQQNPQRLMRALAIVRTTGRSITEFWRHAPQKRPFDCIKIGLQLPKEQLWSRIEQRTRQMMSAGLLEEARALYPKRHFNALQTVGYQELFAYLEGQYPLEEAIQRIVFHTRQYAKRQLTWFKRDREIRWFMPDDLDGMLAYIRDHIEKRGENHV